MANLTGIQGLFLSEEYVDKRSVDELIQDLVDTATQVTRNPSKEEVPRRGVVLMGSTYRDRVRGALEMAHLEVIDCNSRREAVDRGYHLIELDSFFLCHGY